MDEMTLTLSSPITEEQFDAITDVDFDNTDRIWFHTKNGKDVEFVKRKKGKWSIKNGELAIWDVCSECRKMVMHKAPFYNFCPNCGAYMREETDEGD